MRLGETPRSRGEVDRWTDQERRTRSLEPSPETKPIRFRTSAKAVAGRTRAQQLPDMAAIRQIRVRIRGCAPGEREARGRETRPPNCNRTPYINY